MKLIIVKIILFAFLAGGASWGFNFGVAQRQAKDQKKLIMLNFSGSDWCGPCIKLKKEVLDQTSFLEFANDNVVLVRADFPRKKKNKLDAAQTTHNESLAEKYNPKGKFPLTLLLNSEGKILKEWEGYSKTITIESLKSEIKAVAKK